MKKVYVVGHKNPDTDSICSAIAYAHLKHQITGGDYRAKRAGQINEETQYVLKRFGVTAPGLLSNVQMQVRDLDISKVPGVSSSMSIKEGWALMKAINTKTLPITKDGYLEGLITIGDIATSYMDVLDGHILADAKTSYHNIKNTLDGKMIIGDESDCFSKGKVVIAASSPELMENFIEPQDLVILGNRYETQLCALEMEASCLVVCQGAQVSRTIKKIAQERNCVIISTPHDTFTVARLIHQSIALEYFMSKDNLVTFRTNEYVEDIKEVMTKKRFRDFPVLDKNQRFVGFISRSRIVNPRKKNLILVDHNEKTQAVDGIEEADISEIIDHHRLGTSIETVGPVYFRNQPVGCTATIIYHMYIENHVEIDKINAALLCSAITSDTLMFRSPTCTLVDREAAEKLAEIAEIDIEELAKNMFKAGSNLTNKTAKEICFQDFKTFNVSGVSLGVGQINSMNAEEIVEIKERIVPYLKTALHEKGNDMMFMMLTNIGEESTELLCEGNGARTLALEAFDLSDDSEELILRGVVSRKKQLIPAFVISLQN